MTEPKQRNGSVDRLPTTRENHTVSVIIPTKNRFAQLSHALDSVRNQTYKEIEVIVVDDGSNPPVLAGFVESHLGDIAFKLIRNAVSLGGAKSRNLGLTASTGAYIAFLDDDDIYYPDKLEVLLHALTQNPTYGAAFGLVKFFDGTRHLQILNRIEGFNPSKNIRLLNIIHNNATLIKKEALTSLSFYEALTRFQDLQFNVELTMRTNVLFVEHYVAEWRIDQRSDQITASLGREKRYRDSFAFELLVSYFRHTLKIDKEHLVYYEAKLAKMCFSARRFKKLTSILASNGMFVKWIGVLKECHELNNAQKNHCE